MISRRGPKLFAADWAAAGSRTSNHIVHQKKKMRARRARAETTIPRPTARMTAA
jgi:hypothetical protein